MEFRVLGVVEALEHGLPVSLGGPKQKSLLAMLLLDVNHTVSTDRLVDGLWGDEPPDRAAATIHVYVSKLRKAIEPDRTPRAEPTRLLTQPPGYLLAVDPADVDLFRFEEMVGVARSLWADGCVVGASVLFREALGLWREAPLADLADEPFARFEVARLEEARTGAIEDRIDADLALGRAVELLPELEALVARHPYRERLHRQLMLALYRAGQQADALAAYQRAREALVDDLGLEPGRELREMESAILVQEPDLAWSEPTAITADEAARVLRTANRAEPDEDAVATVVEEARTSARRSEDALRAAIDREYASRLSASMVAAGATQVELDRARRVIVDGVLDRRVRRAPRPVAARGGTTASVAVGACPYKGLLRFEPEDAEWYFGRERLVAELLAGVASTRCVGIVGASGSGKSSLTRAGLVAALRDDALPGSSAWPRLLVTPSTDPVLELARALAPVSHAASADHVRDQLLDDPESISAFASRATESGDPDASVMIVVDQLEEVFTVCRDDEVRARFLDVLVHAATDPDTPAKVLAAIRADYYGRCADHADFADLLGRANVLVGPMRPDELQRAIEEPARGAGLMLEDGLLDRILDDVGTEPGSLPLLETALLETWNRRDGNVLTLDGYEATGGVRGAVAHLADDVYARMSSSEQDIARGIFLRLAEPGVGNDDVRRRAPLDELLVGDEHAHVLGSLVEHRLVVTSDHSAEVAHEALLREWPRLRGWLEEDREGRRVQRALSIAAQDWATADRNDDLLFRGTRLAAALDVADAHPAEINPVERDFLGASRAHQDVELRTAQRTTHRLRRLTGALAVFLVVALVASVFSLVQRSRANRNADRAEEQVVAAEARRLGLEGRNAAAQDRIDLALLLAVQARHLYPSAESDAALQAALLAAPPGVERYFDFNLRDHWNVDRRFDNFTVVEGTDPSNLFVLDPATGKLVRQLNGVQGGSGPAALSPDGRWAIAGSQTGIVNLWDAETGRRVGSLETGAAGPVYGAFDPSNPNRLFAVAYDGQVLRWDLGSGDLKPVDVYRAPASVTPEFPNILRLSKDGSRLGVGGATAGPTYVVDTATGALVRAVPGTLGDFSPDGSVLLTSLPEGAQRWDLNTGERVGAPFKTADGPKQLGPLAAFSPDGRFVVVGDFAPNNYRVLTFDVGTGQYAIAPISSGATNPVPNITPQGLLLVTRSARAVAVRLGQNDVPPIGNVVGRPDVQVLTFPTAGRDEFVTVDFAIGPDGRFTTSPYEGTQIWDASTGKSLENPRPPSGGPGRFLFPSPNRKRFTDGWIEEIRVWQKGRAAPLDTIPFDPDDPPKSRWWSPNSRLLTIEHTNSVDLYRVRHGSLERVATLDPAGPKLEPQDAKHILFTPDSQHVAVATSRGAVVSIFDTNSGRRERVVRLGSEFIIDAVDLSPDGRTLGLALTRLPGGGRATVKFLDVETGGIRARGELPVRADSLVFIQDGAAFATLENIDFLNSSVSLWDATTFRPIGRSMDAAGPGFALAATGDGDRVVLGKRDGGAVVWAVDPELWERQACKIAGRPLTKDEWAQYLPGRPYDPACA